MITLDAQNIQQQYLHRIMLGSIAPRPIAFASTIDKDGNPNLSPFSFFNAFGVNPGTLVFSPSRRGRIIQPKILLRTCLKYPKLLSML
jgi:flavin reductase (DIM6/NTAB) family NADH-FMN oxidoreductase RutF